MATTERKLSRSFTSAALPKTGTRPDIGFYVRSSWEANMVRYYRSAGIVFEYEKREFEFEGLKRGNRFYKPDFYLPETNKYVEVKGWLDKDSMIKLKRFLSYHPNEARRLVLVIDRIFMARGAKLTKTASQLVEMGYSFNQLVSYAHVDFKCRNVVPNWE